MGEEQGISDHAGDAVSVDEISKKLDLRSPSNRSASVSILSGA
jgi:hypothetical protein